MPECRPQRGAFETWILCSGVEIGAFTGDAATGCGGPIRPNREKPNKYRYIPPAVVGMLEIAMQACQVSSESIRKSPSLPHSRARAPLQNCRSPEFCRAFEARSKPATGGLHAVSDRGCVSYFGYGRCSSLRSHAHPSHPPGQHSGRDRIPMQHTLETQECSSAPVIRHARWKIPWD